MSESRQHKTAISIQNDIRFLTSFEIVTWMPAHRYLPGIARFSRVSYVTVTERWESDQPPNSFASPTTSLQHRIERRVDVTDTRCSQLGQSPTSLLFCLPSAASPRRRTATLCVHVDKANDHDGERSIDLFLKI